MAVELFYAENSNMIELIGLQDAADLAYLNAATVTVTIEQLDGTDLPGETWPVTLSYVAASDGDYRGTVSAAIDVSAVRRARAIIDATEGGLVGHWEIPIRVVTREV